MRKRLWPISVYYVGSNIKGHKTFSATDVLVITEIAYLPNTSTCVTCDPAYSYLTFSTLQMKYIVFTLFSYCTYTFIHVGFFYGILQVRMLEVAYIGLTFYFLTQESQSLTSEAAHLHTVVIFFSCPYKFWNSISCPICSVLICKCHD